MGLIDTPETQDFDEVVRIHRPRIFRFVQASLRDRAFSAQRSACAQRCRGANHGHGKRKADR
ncbi:hypothetical protein SBA4_2370021 [Candidatus Sulfopaludibacter sp. SbA4]|nr:hypothetical protein SBA4_2370021 [Candidatus Sulfopaludibacter sp. SbA4]